MPGVTKEQIRQAREADLFAYLERHERGVLKRDGPNYRHKEHDSLVYVTAKNYWYWNSRGKRINALDYLMEIRGYGLVDAVNALAGPAMQYSFPSRDSQDYAAARQARKPDHCYLPWQKKCATSYVSYLQKRGISTVVIKRCTQLGILYEGSYKKKEPEGKATYIPVCVFVGKDEHGTAKFACMRGIHSDLRKDAYGSDKEYSFCLPPHRAGSRHVAVFEAPIDALSHATLQEMDGWKWDGYRLSLGGTSHVALFAFLERHPKIRHVDLYMDSDYAGLKNARKIKDMLRADPRFKHNAIQDGLFQTVIQYKRKENGEVVIISPKTTYKLDIKHVKELSAPPQYIYGECVSPCNHPDMIGIVCDIAWHFKLNCYFYIIKVNGRPKSKRYYDGDLNPIV